MAHLGCRCRSIGRLSATLKQTHSDESTGLHQNTLRKGKRRRLQKAMTLSRDMVRNTPPLTAKLGYANLATAKIKLTSATTVGRCRRTASRDTSGCRVYCSVQKDGVITEAAAVVSCPRVALLLSRGDWPVTTVQAIRNRKESLPESTELHGSVVELSNEGVEQGSFSSPTCRMR